MSIAYIRIKERLTYTVVGKKSVQKLLSACTPTWSIAFSASLGSSKKNGLSIVDSILIQLVQGGVGRLLTAIPSFVLRTVLFAWTMKPFLQTRDCRHGHGMLI